MKHFHINRMVLVVCIALILYYVIMELYYVYFITPNYLYYGFRLDIDSYKYIETKILFIAILVFLLYISKISEFLFSILLFFIIFFLVPSLITYSLCNQRPGPLYSTIALLIGLGVISPIKIKIPSIKRIPFSYGVIIFILLMLMVPILFNYGLYLNINNLFLDDISKTRDYFEEGSSTLVNYLYNWLIKAIVPLLLVFFLIHKRYGYAVISILVLLYLYIISGNKLVYITFFTVLFFFFVGKNYFEKTKYFSIALICGLLILPLADLFILSNNNLRGLFVMRMLFLPSQLNYYYFDFFSGNPLYFAQSSFFNVFFDYPYERPIGYVISQTYFSSSTMNANNGIIGDGFMNLGYWGVGLNILIVSLIFLFFNSMNLDSRYLGIFFVMIFLFLSVPMLSMFITSGLWIIFLMGMSVMKSPAANI